MSLVVYDVEQGTQEWLDLRLGIITASNAQKLLVSGKSKEYAPFGDGAITYMIEKITEQYTGVSQSSFDGNEHTERGHELEPVIAEYYLAGDYNKGESIELAGIGINHGVGASPDRLVGLNGGLEIKAPLAKNVMELHIRENIKKDYLTQCQCNMWVWEREWWDFMAVAEGVPPFVRRIYRDDTVINLLAERTELFYEMMDSLVKERIY